MLNHITVMGRLTHDPEMRKTPSGVSVVNFTVAVDRDIKNKETGERETDFLDVVVWRYTADYVSKYCAKGSQVVVDGRLQIRNWTDKDGNKRKNAEIQADSIYITGKKNEDAGHNENASAPAAQAAPVTDDNEDEGDLPF